jgi:parallel beta-helix repeat protein
MNFFVFNPINSFKCVPLIDKNYSHILYVGGNGPDNYTRIQDAINDTVEGDTVFVYRGTYYEFDINISKSINLVGEDKNTTTIDAQNKGNVIVVNADDVLITGFTLLHCKYRYGENFEYNIILVENCNNSIIRDNRISIGFVEYNPNVAGICFRYSSNNQIKNNIIFNEEVNRPIYGIVLHRTSTFNNISNNEIYGYTTAIWIYTIVCDDNTIYGNFIHHNHNGIHNWKADRIKILNNTITYCSSNGIADDFGEDFIISGNTITHNGEGGQFDSGIMLNSPDDGARHQVTNNIISNNNPTGVYLLGSNCNHIFNNIISDNTQIGIYVYNSHNNSITDNHISDNGKYGVAIYFGNNNEFLRNNFIDNRRNADFIVTFSERKSNIWDDNYWSNVFLPGILPKFILGDGMFLIFYPIPCFNIDWHPAKEPYGILYLLHNIALHLE